MYSSLSTLSLLYDCVSNDKGTVNVVELLRLPNVASINMHRPMRVVHITFAACY